jgi:hypothetical protein
MTIRCASNLRALSRPISKRMDTVQIRYTVKDVTSVRGVYPSDRLPCSIVQTGSVIVNMDPHTEEGSHWLAIHFQPKFSSAFYFDSYGNPASVPDIQDFIRRCCTVCHYNTVWLRPTTTFCGHYCCLFVLYMDRGYTPQNSWPCLKATSRTERSSGYSHPNSEGPPHAARIAEEGSVASLWIKGESSS